MSKIKELKPGQTVTTFFLLTGLQEKQTKAGKAYLDMNFTDNTGSINAKLWDYNKSRHQFNSGDILKVQAKVSEYQGQKQLSIEKIRKAEDADNVSVAEFYRVSERNFDEMKSELFDVINSIQNKHLKELLQLIFSGEKLEKFLNVPAGKAWHHAYIHGLLEHTLEIVKLCELTATFHKEVNRDLLISGALLHDFGKTEELSDNADFGYTDKGKLLGHIVIAAMEVEKAVMKIPDFPEDLKNQLEHLILSHQGRLEFASPVVPKMLESIILYHADELSAKANAYKNAIEAQSGGKSSWTTFIRLAETDLYIPNNKTEE
jgi:3'-5' exoribonuclease